MSTKIYTGFKIPNKSMQEVLGLVTELQKEVKPIIQSKQDSYVAKRAAALYDRCYFFNKLGELSKKSALHQAFSELSERQMAIKSKGLRDPEVDFQFELTFFPTKDSILGMYFCDHKDLAAIWMSKPFVTEYAYWDNSDPPESISDEEWDRMGSEWDAALSDEVGGIPALAGFTITVSRSLYVPNFNNILQAIPPLRVRAQDLVLDGMFGQWLQKAKLKDPEVNPFKEYRLFSDWQRTEGAAIVENQITTTMQKLKLALTTMDITSGNI